MKNNRRSLFPFLICIFALISSGCSIATAENHSSKSVKTSLQAQAEQDINKLLGDVKLEISKDPEIVYFYITVLGEDSSKTEKYELREQQPAKVNVPKNKDFVLSLPEDNSSHFNWVIENELDESLIKQKNKSYLKTSIVDSLKIEAKSNFLNIHFQALRSGRQNIALKSEQAAGKPDQDFNSSVIITVQ